MVARGKASRGLCAQLTSGKEKVVVVDANAGSYDGPLSAIGNISLYLHFESRATFVVVLKYRNDIKVHFGVRFIFCSYNCRFAIAALFDILRSWTFLYLFYFLISEIHGVCRNAI